MDFHKRRRCRLRQPLAVQISLRCHLLVCFIQVCLHGEHACLSEVTFRWSVAGDAGFRRFSNAEVDRTACDRRSRSIFF